MTHHEATAILNRAKEGQQFSQFVITRALELTGDYEEQKFEKLENNDDKNTTK